MDELAATEALIQDKRLHNLMAFNDARLSNIESALKKEESLYAQGANAAAAQSSLLEKLSEALSIDSLGEKIARPITSLMDYIASIAERLNRYGQETAEQLSGLSDHTAGQVSVEQTNNYYVPVPTPAELSRQNEETSRLLAESILGV